MDSLTLKNYTFCSAGCDVSVDTNSRLVVGPMREMEALNKVNISLNTPCMNKLQ